MVEDWRVRTDLLRLRVLNSTRRETMENHPKYPKLYNPFMRDEKGKLQLELGWSSPEIEYLSECDWEFTEKIDGANIRICLSEGKVRFRGRTDDGLMHPQFIETQLIEMQSIFTGGEDT